MLKKLPHFTIFAHRGSSNHAPENTISAFNLAIQHDAHAIELDVMLSADNRVVVIHDHTVDRTTDGSGQVRKMKLDDLQALDAGSYFNVQFKGEKIPTLEEVFSSIGRKIYINIEIKNLNTPFDPLPQITAELVKEYHLEDEVLFSSFNPFALIKIRSYLPESDTALLVGNGSFGAIMQRALSRIIPHTALHPNLTMTNPRLVKKVHRRGQRIHVYTIDDTNTMEKLYEMGVDGIFTNDPLLARKLLDSLPNKTNQITI
jgi:glycerophosphoryl diester phosphodiesterase